jgi:hypothetical protein
MRLYRDKRRNRPKVLQNHIRTTSGKHTKPEKIPQGQVRGPNGEAIAIDALSNNHY